MRDEMSLGLRIRPRAISFLRVIIGEYPSFHKLIRINAGGGILDIIREV
jgi:hypothetical protein